MVLEKNQQRFEGFKVPVPYVRGGQRIHDWASRSEMTVHVSDIYIYTCRSKMTVHMSNLYMIC